MHEGRHDGACSARMRTTQAPGCRAAVCDFAQKQNSTWLPCCSMARSIAVSRRLFVIATSRCPPLSTRWRATFAWPALAAWCSAVHLCVYIHIYIIYIHTYIHTYCSGTARNLAVGFGPAMCSSTNKWDIQDNMPIPSWDSSGLYAVIRVEPPSFFSLQCSPYTLP